MHNLFNATSWQLPYEEWPDHWCLTISNDDDEFLGWSLSSYEKKWAVSYMNSSWRSRLNCLGALICSWTKYRRLLLTIYLYWCNGGRLGMGQAYAWLNSLIGVGWRLPQRECSYSLEGNWVHAMTVHSFEWWTINERARSCEWILMNVIKQQGHRLDHRARLTSGFNDISGITCLKSGVLPVFTRKPSFVESLSLIENFIRAGGLIFDPSESVI